RSPRSTPVALHDALPISRTAQERDHVRTGVARDPLEAVRIRVELPQRRVLAVDAIELANQVGEAAVHGLVEDPPVEAVLLGPLGDRKSTRLNSSHVKTSY